MPFTPYHIGPALALGLVLRGRFHAPTFIVANVVLDIEPFLAISLGWGGALHGIFHTFLVAACVGAVCGLIMRLLMRLLEGRLGGLFRAMKLEGPECGKVTSTKAFLTAGVLGCLMHVLFDAPLYADIRPFFPLVANPLYSPASAPTVYDACIWLGIAGLVYWIALFLGGQRRRA
jgi:hypothetical protein